MSSEHNLFGQALRSLRESKNISLRSFAKQMGWSAAYQSDVELGRRGPLQEKRVRQAAAILGADPDKLWLVAVKGRRRPCPDCPLRPVKVE